MAHNFIWLNGARLSAGIKENILGRDNYSFKKYQKELARKKKAEEKKQRKLEKKAAENVSQPTFSDVPMGEHSQVSNGQPIL